MTETAAAKIRVALVTGAGRPRGIGAAIAVRLAAGGGAVALSDRIPEGEAGAPVRQGLEEVAERVRDAGGTPLVLALDVTSPREVEEAIAATVAAFGRLDTLVNNAGTGLGVGKFLEVDDSRWDLSWQVNVMGAVRLSRAAMPHLKENSGCIVNIASTMGLGAEAGYGAYTVTKHAVVGLTRLLAAELGPEGVRVNAVAPGMIHTDLGAAELELLAAAAGASVEDTTREVIQSIPLRRLGDGGDVAEAVEWLTRPGSYVSGTVLPVHGAAAVGLN